MSEERSEHSEPSVADLWGLLKRQQAEIAELRSRLNGAGTGADSAETPGHAGTGFASGGTNGKQSTAAQVAPTRKGWHLRRGTRSTAKPQLLLPKPDDTTPVGIERRLSRAGLLKGATAGTVGLAAAEVGGTIGAPGAAASTPSNQFVAVGGAQIAFATGAAATGANAYLVAAQIEAKNLGVRSVAHGNPAQSQAGVGVWGISDSGTGRGVAGFSYSDSTQKTLGDGIGVEGASGTGTGVHGISTIVKHTPLGGRGGTSVLGESVGGNGVVGQSIQQAGTGVRGVDMVNTGTGVRGVSYADSNQQALGAGIGVSGISGSGTGMQGEGHTGVFGWSQDVGGRGVYGRNSSAAGTGIFGEQLDDNSHPGAGVRV